MTISAVFGRIFQGFRRDNCFEKQIKIYKSIFLYFGTIFCKKIVAFIGYVAYNLF